MAFFGTREYVIIRAWVMFMQKVINKTTINYEYFNNDSNISLVFLHGWGQNIEMMMILAKPFITKYNVLVLDLPGFGASSEPDYAWSLDDYAKMLNILIKELKLDNIILIGHSFGGKLALVYALKYEVKKLVLLASPFRKNITKPTLKMRFYKFVKKTPGLRLMENFVKNKVGSVDYRNATPMMRAILVKHVNLDLTEEVAKIKCPTLLIWGTNDEVVSYEDALKLEKLIPNAGLVTYEGATHYAYLERLKQTIRVLASFIGSDEL